MKYKPRSNQINDLRLYETPQANILFAVIQQALRDAGTEKKPKRYSAERQKSRRWIMGKGSNFPDACDLLGIDAGVIRRGLRQTTTWANEY